MKEDVQLVCPVSYEDPQGVWPKLQIIFARLLPFTNVTWKNPVTTNNVTIESLPLRFLPSSARLFDDTDHSFRWFLAPYVSLYILSCDSLERYKTYRPAMRKFVDSVNATRRVPWLIIFSPSNSMYPPTVGKVFSRLGSEFYVEKVGDRTVLVDNAVGADQNKALHDLDNKLREGIILSFRQRTALYDLEIRRLDASRGTAHFDFRQLFLVKESLALMYQMMQMHEAALVQYKELGAIVSYAPSSLLSSSEWPMVAGESLESSDSISSKDSNLQALEKLCQGENDSTDHDKSLALSSGNEFFSSKVREKRDEVSDKMSVVSLKQVERKLEMKDCLSDAYRNGDDILAYSINIARMKILRCKLNFLEVHRYIFAREMYFLLALQRPVDFARKAMDYLSNTFHAAMKNICSKHSDSSKTYVVRIKQAELWLIACTLKIVRAGRDLLNRGHPVEAPNILNAFSEKYSSSIGLPVALNNDHTFISTSQILVELLSCTLSKLNHLSPTISTVARSEISLAIERTLLNLTDDSVEIFPQSGQFLSQIVVAEKSISDVLEKELSAADFGLQGSVDKPLGLLYLKLRSVSHYWAIHLSNFETQSIEADTYEQLRLNHYKKYSKGDEVEEESGSCPPSQDFVAGKQGSLHSRAKKGHILEVLLLSYLLQSLAELAGLAGRSRFANQYQIDCGDLLLHNGLFDRAFRQYSQALCAFISKSSFWQNGSNVLVVLEKDNSDGSEIEMVPAHLPNFWEELLKHLHLKMLLCAFVLNNKRDYRIACSQLFYLLHVANDQEIVPKLLMIMIESSKSETEYLKLPALQFFNVSIKPSSTATVWCNHGKTYSGYLTEAGENLQFQSIDYEGGSGMCEIDVEIDSSISCILPIEEIRMTLISLPSGIGNGSVGDSDESCEDQLQSEDLLLNGVVAQTMCKTSKAFVFAENVCRKIIAEHSSSCPTTISYGKQTIKLQFEAEGIGEYCIQSMDFVVGSLKFSGNFFNHENGSIRDVKNYLKNYSIVRILQPMEPLRINGWIASCSPTKQLDEVVLSVSTLGEDKVEELSIVTTTDWKAECGISFVKIDNSCPSLEIFAGRKMHGNYRTVSPNKSHALSDQAVTSNILILPESDWRVTFDQNMLAVVDGTLHSKEQKGAFAAAINDGIIIVPFIPETSASPTGVAFWIVLKGFIRRKVCKIPFLFRIDVRVFSLNMLTTQTSVFPLHTYVREDFALICEVVNQGSVPIAILGYTQLPEIAISTSKSEEKKHLKEQVSSFSSIFSGKSVDTASQISQFESFRFTATLDTPCCIDLHYQRSSDLGALSDIVNESFLNAIFRAEKKHFKHTIHLFKEVREFPGEQQDRISSRCVSFQMEVGVSLLQGVPVYVGQSVKFEYQIIVALNNNVIENSDALNTITPSAESITHCDVQSLHVEFSETTDWIPFKRKIVINHIPNGALCSKSPLSIPVVAEMISFSSGKCLLPPLNVAVEIGCQEEKEFTTHRSNSERNINSTRMSISELLYPGEKHGLKSVIVLPRSV